MALPHLFRTYRPNGSIPLVRLGVSRRARGHLEHLLCMDTGTARSPDTERPRLRLIEQVLSLTELCEHLHVSAQTLYDLRSQGRGPQGFRVGRELRFRISEIEAWLAGMESEDDQRHSVGGR
jgi:excisionase family DNA binding protein